MPHLRSTPTGLTVASLLILAGLPSGAAAQFHDEVEPNDSKEAANSFGIAPGDALRGTSTGLSTTVAGPTSVDYYKIRPTAAAPGIYRSRLVVTTTGTQGHSGTIRGFTQSSTGIGTTDSGPQSTFSNTNPPRFLQWYGFGKQEEMYVRLGGTASTTAEYLATFARDPVVPNDLGSFPAGVITFSTADQGHTTDTDLWVYDGNFSAIPDFGNDDSPPPPASGTFTRSRLTREYEAGVYYLAITNANLANNLPSPAEDRNRAREVLEFPDAVICSSNTTGVNISFGVTSNLVTTPIAATKTSNYDINWYKFTVTGAIATGACCTGPEGVCSVATETVCVSGGGEYMGNATACGSVACPMFVRTSRGSGSAAGIGQFIDVTPVNSIVIDRLNYHVTTSSAPGAPLQIDIWVKDGTYREAESFDPAKWTLHETVFGTSVGGGADYPVNVTLANPILAQAGRTRGLFVHTIAGTMHFRTNNSRSPAAHSNSEVQVYSERYRFGTGGGGWNGTLTPFRDFHGAIYHSPANQAVTGACCLPGGTCQVTTLANCGAQDGLFRGAGSECAAVTCEAKGACCYPTGVCSIVYQFDCTGINEGTWSGPGTTCGSVVCPEPGACCFHEGACTILHSTTCAAAGGTYLGDGVTCAAGGCWTAPILWNNGPQVTGDNIGGVPAPDQRPFSEVQAGNVHPGSYLMAWGVDQDGLVHAVTDNFTIQAPGGWHIDDVTVFGFRNSTTQAAAFTAAFVEIWNGQPGSPGASVVFGDLTTNRLVEDTVSHYRALSGVWALNRVVHAVRANVNHTLPAGEYWLRYSLEVDGSPISLTMTPYVTVVGTRTTVGANARQSLGDNHYYMVDDNILPIIRQELPFIIKGQVLGASTCYPNCDGSTTNPFLNVADFTCFLQRFAAGELYANCDSSTTAPVLNVADFTCFLQSFAAGCSAP